MAGVAAAAFLVMGRQLVWPDVYSCLREDTTFYLNWARQVAASLSEGILYPRWMPEAHGGYGNPDFIFYPPLTIYLTAAADLVTRDLGLAATLVKLAGVLFSGLAMYVFVKEIWGTRAGLLAAAAYMALPFRVLDLYFLGAHASKLVYIWFPLALHFTRIAVAGRRMAAGAAGLSICYSMLLLTHTLYAYMFTPVILAFGLLHARSGSRIKATLAIPAALVLGLSLAAFYLLPVFAERPFVHYDELLKSDVYNHQYGDNFVFYMFGPASPLNPHFYGYIGLTVLATVLIVPGLLIMARPPCRALRRADIVFFLCVALGALFLMSSASSFLWEYVPGMRMVQYAPRWGTIMVFGVACVAGISIGRLSGGGAINGPALNGLSGLVLLVCLAPSIYYDTEIIKNSCTFTKDDIAALPRGMDAEEYVPRGVSLVWLRAEEKKPAGALIAPCKPELPVRIKVTGWLSEARGFVYDSGAAATLRIRTFWYPGWRAEVDGGEALLRAEPVSGAMLMDAPKGRHTVRLTFNDTPVRVAGRLISVFAAVFVTYLVIRRYYEQRGSQGQQGGGCA